MIKNKKFKLLNPAEEKLWSGLMLMDSKPGMITNPMSGESVELCPEAIAVYDFIKGAEQLGDFAGMETGLGIFLTNWPKEYMVLLD